MKFFDSHCHLDMEPLSSEREVVIERAFKAGVESIINVGASLRGSRASVEISNLYPNIWASVGLHPHDAGVILDLSSAIDELRQLAKSDKVVAIGEIGLDFFDPEKGGQIDNDFKKRQLELFNVQLGLAAELSLPVILHVRDAWPEVYEIIKNSSKMLGVVHCFTADEKEVKKWLDLGFFIGFTGFVTFEQNKFDHIRKAVRSAPLDRILIETDAPFLAPEPFRGKTNEPAYVVETAKKIAELKNMSIEEVAEATYKNAKKVFNIGSDK